MNKLKIAFIVLVILILSGLALRGKISGEKFDAEKWKNEDLDSERNWSLRWDMMNSLRNDYKLMGMSKTQVINLLGKPIELSQKDSFHYYLGYAKSGIDTGTLVIRFEDNHVSHYFVYRS